MSSHHLAMLHSAPVASARWRCCVMLAVCLRWTSMVHATVFFPRTLRLHHAQPYSLPDLAFFAPFLPGVGPAMPFTPFSLTVFSWHGRSVAKKKARIRPSIIALPHARDTDRVCGCRTEKRRRNGDQLKLTMTTRGSCGKEQGTRNARFLQMGESLSAEPESPSMVGFLGSLLESSPLYDPCWRMGPTVTARGLLGLVLAKFMPDMLKWDTWGDHLFLASSWPKPSERERRRSTRDPRKKADGRLTVVVAFGLEELLEVGLVVDVHGG